MTNEELLNKVNLDSRIYVSNLMNFSPEYDEEVYNKKISEVHDKIKKEIDENKSSEVFKDFTNEELLMNINTMMIGYQFGTAFIDALVDKDPASAKNILEAVFQDYMDLQDFIVKRTEEMEQIVKSQKEKENKKEN